MDDQELLCEYVERQSEKAFANLVDRHINLVYSTALRVVQDAALAKDITQSVFILLARKAPAIRSGHALPGWLYRVTRCQAANAARDDRIRREREMEAMNMKSLETDTITAWSCILPHLDDAMSALKKADQNAIVMRFFEGRSWREIGSALSLSEDTAQKRVSRAVDKLRLHFQRRGIVLSALAISSVIAANAAQAAPSGLASTVASVSLVHAAKAGLFSVLLTHVQALFMKKITYAVLSASLIAAVTIPIIMTKAGDSQSEKAVTKASLQQGLALHYTFDRAPVDGKVMDASGAGNNGQVVGAKWISDTQRGGVFQFSPPNQYILVPNSPTLNPSNLTVAVWIKTSNQGETWRRIFDKGWTDGFALSIVGGHKRGFTGDAEMEIGKTHVAHSNHSVADGKWHHVAVTYNGAEESFYVDGAPQTRNSWWQGGVPSNSHDLTIGINLVDPNPQLNEVGASFDGLVDEPMMFNRALSPDEIKFLFNSQKK